MALFGVGSQPDAALAPIVNVESVPALLTGPSLFSQAGATPASDVNGVAGFELNMRGRVLPNLSRAIRPCH